MSPSSPSKRVKSTLAQEKLLRKADMPQEDADVDVSPPADRPLTAAEKRKATMARKKAEAAAKAGTNQSKGRKRPAGDEAEVPTRPKRSRILPGPLAAGGYKPPAKWKR
jgi:hypothetical protein